MQARLIALKRAGDNIEATFNCEISVPTGGSNYRVFPRPYLDSDRGKISAKELIEAGLQAPEFLGWEDSQTAHRLMDLTFAPGKHEVSACFLQPANSALGVTFDFEIAPQEMENQDV